MRYDENILLALLEYESIPSESLWSDIATALDLYYYKEENTHTLCSNTFVLDISEAACTLQFVNENLNKKFGYIQKYLNEYLGRKDLFYLILRYFATVEGSIKKRDLVNGQPSSVNGRSSMPPRPSISEVKKKYKTKKLCHCVFDGDYCERENDFLMKEEGYNIFLHRKGYVRSNPLIHLDEKRGDSGDYEVCISGDDHERGNYDHERGNYDHERGNYDKDNDKKEYSTNSNGNNNSSKNTHKDKKECYYISRNLSKYFYDEEFYLQTEIGFRETFKKDLAFDGPSGDAHSQNSLLDVFYEDENALVKCGEVFVGGERDRVASFLFRNGLSLKRSLELTAAFGSDRIENSVS